MTQEPPPGDFEDEETPVPEAESDVLPPVFEDAEPDVLPPVLENVAEPGEPEELASVIVIDRNDDVASVCGRIDTAPTYWVILHAPRGNRTLSTELGMRRVKRHAEESGRAVAFATNSPGLISRARQMGIPAARSPESVRWHSGGRTVVSLGRGKALVLPRVGRYVQWLVLFAIIGGLAALVLTMAPSATVVAYPDARVVTTTTRISASDDQSEIDIEARAVPSTTITTSRVFTLVVPATGRETRPNESASATVAITNPSETEFTIPAGTVLLAAPDLLAFETADDLTVEPGGTAEVLVTAAEGGEAYNVAAGTIIGWLDEELRVLQVTNPEAASGGGAVEVSVVAAADVVAIRALEQQVEDADATRKLIAEERPGDAIFLDSLDVSGTEVAPPTAVGTETDLVIVDYRITVTGLAIAAEHLEALAREVLAEEAGEGDFISGSVRAVELGEETYNADTGEIAALFELSGEYVDGVTADEVRDAVKGKSPEDAEATLLERYGMEQADVELTPSFAPWVPRFGFRIDVEFRAEPEDPQPEDADDDANDEDAEDSGP